MNTGMQDAIAAAWRIALTMRGASPRLLDSYSVERSAVGAMVLRNATRLTEIGTLSNKPAQAARDAAVRLFLGFHYARKRLATTMSEIEIAYATSPLSQGRHSGDRFSPDHYEGSVPGCGDDPRFVLYTVDREEGAKLTAQYPSLLQPLPRKPPGSEQLMIVRPDAYTGFFGKAEAWQAARSYLKELTA